MPAVVASQWRDRRRLVFQSVFQTEVSQPTPQPTPSTRSTEFGQPFGGHAPSTYHPTFTPSPDVAPAPSLQTAANDQVTYDRAWHVVTAHIALPSSAAADDSFGTLAAESQQASRRRDLDSDFYDAFALVVNASTLLPRAAHTHDIVAWHLRQVRAHFAQHVIPLLAGCVDEDVDASGDVAGEQDGGRQVGSTGNYYERHMVIVMSSIRTLEAALRLYFYGLNQLLSGFSRLYHGSPEAARDAELLNTRFRRDIHALVSNSASEGLMRSVKVVLVRLAGTVLGIPPREEPLTAGTQPARPAPPGRGDLRAPAARERLLELVQQLRDVGLAGERFHVLFAEVMDAMMSEFVTRAYAGVWSATDPRSFGTAVDTVSQAASSSSASPCIRSLSDWVENHFAQLSFQVLSCISPDPHGPLPVSLADLRTFQSLALGRLAALRIEELFDIVLAWPASRPALDDLRGSIITAARRKQLTDSFSRTLQRRLLHPGCSTLEILQTYISIIRTFHALDPSKVLLSHVEPGLQLYLCQREDAVRVVVSGLLASPEEVRAARKAREAWHRQRGGVPLDLEYENRTSVFNLPELPSLTAPPLPGKSSTTAPGSGPSQDSSSQGVQEDVLRRALAKTTPAPRATKLVELASLLTDPSQNRRAAAEAAAAGEDTDWNDMSWLPDPIDAGANYKRPKSEDVIGTLISALGSEEAFIKEFSTIIAERLLGEAAGFDQELRVLELLKRRFGEAALQNCDVMIRDVQDSRKLDDEVRRAIMTRQTAVVFDTEMMAQAARAVQSLARGEPAAEEPVEYHARILSRLFWPGLEREHFVLPRTIVDWQKEYDEMYERIKSGRKLAWLNQLGQAKVELELRDRSLTVDCTTVQATVIYAFREDAKPYGLGDDDADAAAAAPPPPAGPVRKSVAELYEQLQMDEDLITAALDFWVAQGVLLHRPGSQYYVVAETRDTSLAAATDPATIAAADPAGVSDQPAAEAEAEDQEAEKQASAAATAKSTTMSARERERREMYWRYVQGMLTNASTTMPLGLIAMMLRRLIADGFPWSDEELQEFLGEKVAAGELEIVGAKYKLRK